MIKKYQLNTKVYANIYHEIKNYCTATSVQPGTLTTALLLYYDKVKRLKNQKAYIAIMTSFNRSDNPEYTNTGFWLTEEAYYIYKNRTECHLLNVLYSYFLSLPQEEQNKIAYTIDQA